MTLGPNCKTSIVAFAFRPESVPCLALACSEPWASSAAYPTEQHDDERPRKQDTRPVDRQPLRPSDRAARHDG